VISIEIIYGKIRDRNEVKQKSNNVITCPYCEQKIEIGIEIKDLAHAKDKKWLFFPHINLHGTPLHALICYMNSELEIRNMGVINSVEISRDSATFSQIMKKWSNPY